MSASLHLSPPVIISQLIFYHHIYPQKPSPSRLQTLMLSSGGQQTIILMLLIGPQCLTLVMMLVQRLILELLSRMILFDVAFPIALLTT